MSSIARIPLPQGRGRYSMEDQGPFDRILQPEPPPERDTTAMFIVGAVIAIGIVLLILVLPPISILDSGDGDGGQVSLGTTQPIGELPGPPPPGFELVSELLDVTTQGSAGQPARLTLTLSSTVDPSDALVLFTYSDGSWVRLADARALPDGRSAQGEVSSVPSNVAVMREAERGPLVVHGVLPSASDVNAASSGAMTTLSPEGFVPEADGTVSGELDFSGASNVAIAPVIAARTEEQVANVNTILGSPDLRNAHVQAIVELAAGGSYDGVTIDYQTIDSVRSVDFVAFVQALSGELRGDGRSLILTLPMPVPAGGDWNTFGFDWQTLAPLVQAIRIAPELEQDTYFSRTEAALGYLAAQAGADKLLLTISPLAGERGVDGLRTMTLTDALAVASVPATEDEGPFSAGDTVQALGENLAGGSGLHWDETARAVTFTYTGAGGQRTVWLSNVFSESFKLDLAVRFGLAGVVVDDVSDGTADAEIWPAVSQFLRTGDVELVGPNGDLLQPQWSATGGSFSATNGPTVSWNAPQDGGTYTLTLVVSDGVIRVGQTLEVAVEASANASP